MKITQIQNGDSGLVARTAINESLKSVDTDSSISGDGNTGSALSVVGLSAIAKTITATAKAVYIYDTSKDIIDWRHNENTSWYNEPLNTATRGATREFPSVALIVVETNKITVYDATNPLLPMWRVFTIENSVNTILPSVNLPITISCRNGKIYIGFSDYGLSEIDFISDSSFRWRGSMLPLFQGYASNNIAGSNIANTFTNTNNRGHIASSFVIDTAIATLKDGTDVVYVATQLGLTRIASDGSVSYWNNLGGTPSVISSVSIVGDYVTFGADSTQTGRHVHIQNINGNLINTSIFSSTSKRFTYVNSEIWNIAITPIYFNSLSIIVRKITNNAISTNFCLTLLKPNPTAYGLGLHATITSSFNSGYQYGDIKGVWLADTVAGTVTGGTVADRSYNNSPLTINGTLTKTAVNTGCELVWFNYSLAQTATTTATGYIEWWEEVAGVPTKYVKNLAGTGDYVNGRAGTVSSSVSVAGGTLTINAGVNITLLKVGNGFPTVEQIAHAYNQEKQLFNQNTACTLAGTSDDCVDVDYDSAKDLHHVATTTNKSVFKGLVRVSSKVGAFTSVSAQNDYVAEA